jgi:uroporphyrinogen-III synthase
MRLLVTRPEPDAGLTAQVLRARGHEVLVAPLLRVEAIDAEFGGPWAAVLLTSASAARALSAPPRDSAILRVPAFTVGERTAEAARAAGFSEVVSADGALRELVRLVAARFAGRGARLLYLAGEDRAGDLAGDLAAHGIAVHTVMVYRAVAADALFPDALQALSGGRIDAVLHYSRRSAATLLRLAEEAGVLNALLSVAHYCLSAEVAAPLRERGAERIKVAQSPREVALIDLVGPA